MGPLGPLTIEDLPSSCTAHWVSRRKAEVLAAVDGGLLKPGEACERYRLSPEELAAWRRSLDRAGLPGLRITKGQKYRGSMKA
jgi:hypothetical protein